MKLEDHYRPEICQDQEAMMLFGKSQFVKAFVGVSTSLEECVRAFDDFREHARRYAKDPDPGKIIDAN